MQIRPFRLGDSDQIARLFHDTIRKVNAKDYSEQQLKAWAPDDVHFKDWETFCLSKYTLVADVEGSIAGFAQLEDDGYIDCFYCHKDYQRQGVGSKLYKMLEQKARQMNLKRLSTAASITAEPFFKAKGFIVVQPQFVNIRGQEFKNFRMQKTL